MSAGACRQARDEVLQCYGSATQSLHPTLSPSHKPLLRVIASHIEKTKVSRAVSALEEDLLLSRAISPQDRRAEILSLTDRGREVFADLGQKAIEYDLALRARIGPQIAAQLDELLRSIIAESSADGDGD